MRVVPGGPATAVGHAPYPVAIGLSALFGLLVSAWAGLSVFIGPSFGYRPDGGTGLGWDLARGVLTVAPAVAGVVGCLMILAMSGHWQFSRGRAGLRLGALLTAAAGAWLAIGFLAWRPLEGRTYLASADPLHGFYGALGAAVGPGLLLVAVAVTVVGFLLGSAPYRLPEDEPVGDRAAATPLGVVPDDRSSTTTAGTPAATSGVARSGDETDD